RSRKHARRTHLPSPYHVTASCAATAVLPVTVGESCVSGRCSIEKPPVERRPTTANAGNKENARPQEYLESRASFFCVCCTHPARAGFNTNVRSVFLSSRASLRTRPSTMRAAGPVALSYQPPRQKSPWVRVRIRLSRLAVKSEDASRKAIVDGEL